LPSSAQLYVALHKGTRGDIDFYRRACRGARSVLELGCGDGRIAWALRAPRRVVVGLDNDRQMLELAERRTTRASGRRPAWVCADMATFELGRRFDAILIPFTGFFCLSPQKKRRCLSCVVRHLRPGGKLVLDAYGGHALRIVRKRKEPVVDDFTWIGNVRDGNELYQVFERDEWWPSRQRLDVIYRYEQSMSPPRFAKLRHWYLFFEQVEALLTAHGFAVDQRRLSATVPLEEQWALIARRVVMNAP
jgi:SAM-dependent methyltransferase